VAALPIDGLGHPDGVAVDRAGDVYVADSDHNRVLELPAGAQAATQLPFSGLNEPSDVAVDATGNVYVADYGNKRVLRLAPGSSAATELPHAGVAQPNALAVDEAGNVYVAGGEHNNVLELAAGQKSWSPLPFGDDITDIGGIAVDPAGVVYVVAQRSQHYVVLELPPGADTPRQLPFSGLNKIWAVAVGHAGSVYVVDKETGWVIQSPALN